MVVAQSTTDGTFAARVAVVDGRTPQGSGTVETIAELGCVAHLFDASASDRQVVSACPDIVFVDASSPMTARRLAARIRERERRDALRGFALRHVPIIVYDQRVSPPQWCADAGIDDFIAGPLSLVTAADALGTWAAHTR
jgi:CheY-like chemotaxis protein